MKNPEEKEPCRCGWPGKDPLYVTYHDREWGVPVEEDSKLFEFLLLEGAQAGLSWITILRKREAYRKAFCNFEPLKVAAFTGKEQAELLENSGIVRNRRKITAAVSNARAFLKVQERYGSFAAWMWRFVDGTPQVNYWKSLEEIPAETPLSRIMSRELKSLGFSFVGPVIWYSHMQAMGMVNDHLVSCFRYSELSEKPWRFSG